MSDLPEADGEEVQPYADREIEARLQGYPWDEIDQHLNTSTAAAEAEGYTPQEIDEYLGRPEPDQFRYNSDGQHRLSHDEQFANLLNSLTAPTPITPLEELASGRIAAYARIDNLPVVEMPPADQPEPPPSGLNLGDEYTRNSYARSLRDGDTRSPRDFAERYTGALAGAGGLDTGAAVRSAGELSASLPSDRDFTDAAIGIAHSSGVALDGGNVKTIRNNLIDHWAGTGQPIMDTYRQAQNDPEFAQSLTAEPKPDPDFLARMVAFPIAIGEFLKGAGIGLTSGGEELRAKVDSGEIGSLPEALGAAIGHLPAGMVEGMWDTAKRAGEALMGGDPLTPEEAVNAAAFGLKFKAFHAPTPRSMSDMMAGAPPVPEGKTRLYRVDGAPGEEPRAPAADNPQPQEVQDALRGRWWTDNPQSVQHYLDDPQRGNTVYHVDVPKEEAELYRLSNNPNTHGAIYSGAPDREFVLPESVTERYGGRSVLGSNDGVFVPQATVLDPEAAAGQAVTLQPGPSVFGEKARQVVDTLDSAASRLDNVPENLKGRLSQHAAAEMADDIHVGGQQPGIEPIEVWHGSPHDFDRFDTSKIGLGEGNQVYGHGIYFAEQRAVGEGYQKKLGETGNAGYRGEMGDIQKEGLRMVNQSGTSRRWEISPQEVHNNLIENYTNTFETMEDRAARVAEVMGKPVDEAAVASKKAELGQKIEALKSLDNDKLSDKPGALYKVNLHVDQDKLFDWDTPLSQQPEAVQKIFEKLGVITKGADGELVFPQEKGRELLNKIGSNKTASEKLQQEGLDGIKYLDGGSRMNGEGTRNYVIFDDAKMEMLEKNGTPINPAKVQQQIEAVAEGQRAASGIFGMARDLGLDLLADERGALNLPPNPFGNPAKAAERTQYVTDRDYARSLVIKGQAQVDQLSANLNHTFDNWKTATGKIENVFAPVNKHMPEWRGELRKGINGDPMNTFMGNMVDYAEGRSMGAAMRHDSPLTPAADAIRHVNEQVRTYLEDLHSKGIINSNSYFEDYFVHNFKDPNKAARAIELYTGMSGKMGSKGNLMQRHIPTIGDALRMGLELVHENPLEATLLDAMNKIKYGKSMEMLHQAHADGQVHFRAKPLPGEVELMGSRMEKAVPNSSTGMILRGYARPGFATAWNDSFGNAFSRQPGFATGLYEKALYAKNTASSISLVAPVFHAKTEITEAFASYIGNTLQMLASGHPVLAAEQALKGVVSPVSAYFTGAKGYAAYKTLSGDTAMNYLVDNGMRVGPRQDIYRLGSAPNLSESWRRGSFGEEFKKELAHIAGDPNDPMANRIATAPLRVPGVIGHELSRYVSAAGGWLFDNVIPRMKLGVNLERMRTYLDANPLATEEQKNAYARQIANNTDDRLGEMNMNNVFWPQMVKRAAQLTMLSTTWKYGSIRMTTSAFGYNMERRAFEWNPVATTNLIGFGIAYMMENAAYQTLMTGQSPWASNTPFSDLIRPRTGGANTDGTPERGMLPSQAKEFWDWYKIAAFAIHAPAQLPVEAVAYGAGAMAPMWRYLVGLTTGKDATGHDIAFQAGGGHAKFAKDTFAPILMNAMEGRKKGTGIPEWQTRVGVRPMNAPAQDWDAFQASQDKGDDRRAKDAYNRAVHDNKIYEVQRPLPSKPGGGSDVRIRAFLNGGPAPAKAAPRSSAQDDKVRQFLRQR